MKDNTAPLPPNWKQMTELAIAKDEKARQTAKLFNLTELAKIHHTADNVAHAINVVKLATQQIRSLVEMAVVQRGMYLCWLKSEYTEHGDWEKFCAEHFPDIPKRTRCFWMAAYLQEVGEKKPKELPAYEPDEMEDQELADAIEDLSLDKKARMPRKAMIEIIDKQNANAKKGQQQLEEARTLLRKKEEEIDQLRQSAFIPAHIKDEAQRIEFLRNAFWAFVKTWIENLPVEEQLIRLHLSLFKELSQEMLEVWVNDLGPQIEAKQAKAEEKNKKN